MVFIQVDATTSEAYMKHKNEFGSSIKVSCTALIRFWRDYPTILIQMMEKFRAIQVVDDHAAHFEVFAGLLHGLCQHEISLPDFYTCKFKDTSLIASNTVETIKELGVC